jgi:hypothetical protein
MDHGARARARGGGRARGILQPCMHAAAAAALVMETYTLHTTDAERAALAAVASQQVIKAASLLLAMTATSVAAPTRQRQPAITSARLPPRLPPRLLPPASPHGP